MPNGSMKEHPSNIGLVCDAHASKPGKFSGNDPKTFLKKFCKLGFKGVNPRTKKEITEHMWVFVHEVMEDGELHGTLDNDPVCELDPPFVCGDWIGFRVEEIEEVME